MVNAIKISKSLNIPIKKFKRKDSVIPIGAKLYDIVTGSIPNRGAFEIISFRDKHKRLVGKEMSFFDSEHNHNFIRETIENFSEYGARVLNRMIYVNNKLKNSLYNVCYRREGHFIQTSVNANSDNERHSISLLQRGQKPVRISYLQNWEQDNPDLNYENTNGATIQSDNLNYIPIWIADGFKENLNKVIAYITRIQEKFHDMPEGVIPEPIIVKHRELNSNRHTRDESMGVCDPFTGQICISEKADSNIDLLGIIAHEYQHAVDISDCMRLESNAAEINAYSESELQSIDKDFPGYLDFFKRSVTRGKIQDESEKGRMLNHLASDIDKELSQKMSKKEHDNLELEKRAIQRADVEDTKLDTIIKSVLNFLESFVGKKK